MAVSDLITFLGMAKVGSLVDDNKPGFPYHSKIFVVFIIYKILIVVVMRHVTVTAVKVCLRLHRHGCLSSLLI